MVEDLQQTGDFINSDRARMNKVSGILQVKFYTGLGQNKDKKRTRENRIIEQVIILIDQLIIKPIIR